MPVAQTHLPHEELSTEVQRPGGQVLKWVGNKFRYAEAIASHFPADFATYYEPFVGTGAVLGTLAPERAIAGDSLPMLIALHKLVQSDPQILGEHYAYWRKKLASGGRTAYKQVRDSYNTEPNPLDLLVISRSCYGGVMRFTREGKISTPMGPHNLMPAEKVQRILWEWHGRLQGTTFLSQDFSATMESAGDGDLVYCDPPYLHGQSILYGAQDFKLARLWDGVADAVGRGAHVAVSVDGWRRSGAKNIELGIPEGLFEKELIVERGGCMLRRFQMTGESMGDEQVADRLLLTW